MGSRCACLGEFAVGRRVCAFGGGVWDVVLVAADSVRRVFLSCWVRLEVRGLGVRGINR